MRPIASLLQARLPMLLNDPLTLLLLITPFGLLTTLMLCLSGVGIGKRHTPLLWWLAGDLLLAAYRSVDLLQPGVATGSYARLAVLSPVSAFLANTALLMLAIGGHTLALGHLAGRACSPLRQLLVLSGPALVYGVGASVLLHGAYIVPWFLLLTLSSIALQLCVTYPLKRRYRGAWGLLAGQLALLLFHGYNTLQMLIKPLPPLPFDEPDMFSLAALGMDFMVSFLFTLCFGLMLQEQLRLDILQMSLTDTLTGALNRRGATAQLFEGPRRLAAPANYPMCVALLDLDNFKRINDQYGHAAGDIALRVFASNVLRLKPQDVLFARWGGEEFLLVFPHTHLDTARQFLGQLRQALSEAKDSPAPIRFSAGLAQTHAMATQSAFETVLHAVDQALYRAKSVRDRVEWVEPVAS